MTIKRVLLHERLPLKTPFSMHIFPIFYCNFKCSYCLHSLSEEQLKSKNFRKEIMPLAIFKKAIDDLTEFPEKLKALVFAGHGEPLLHKEIVEMVAYAKKKCIADRIEIVTNGSLLTKEMSEGLIRAGLDRLRISLQGVNNKKYAEVSGINIDFEQFVKNIQYFYEIKKATEVYIKIIDLAFESEQEEILFRQIFSPIADEVAVEYAIPFINEIDLGKLSENCKQGNHGSSSICSMPFYMLVLYPDGDVLPCCSVDIPKIYGSIRDRSVKDIWESDDVREYLLKHLNGYKTLGVCNNCAVPSYGLQEGDYLDGHEERLKKIYSGGKDR